MNIYYLVNARMPTEKAHGYQIAKTCEALALQGAYVSLVVPTRKNEAQGDFFSYYGVQNNFSIKYVPAFDALAFFRGTRLGFYAQAVSFLCVLRRVGISRDTVIITRNPEVAWWCTRKGCRVFYDAHNFPSCGSRVLRWLIRNTAGIMANSNGTAEAFRRVGFSNILVAPNAVDLASFSGVKRDRGELGLPAGKTAMYVGHLYGWKGVGTVVAAARQSKILDLTFVFVGGTDNDLARYRSKTKDFSNIVFLGRRPHEEVPALIMSADVLLLPNIPSTQESTFYTSPIKMFEYMASGVPIVASDLPSIREVLNDDNAILVKAGDPGELLRGVTQALLDEKNERGVQAKEDVRQYTWIARAKKILGFIKSR